MKKLFYSMFILAMTAMTFTSCEDVPEPYNNPNNAGGSSAQTGSLPYTSSSLNDWSVVTPKGVAWSLGSTYAKASGYVDGSNTETETWLISPVINTTTEVGAIVDFQHVIRYVYNADDINNHKMYISKDYADDVTTATWTELNYVPEASTTNTWDFYDAKTVTIPDEYLNSDVVLAFKFTASATASTTWELKALTVSEGVASEDDTPDTPVTPVDDGNGDGTEANPYNVTAAKSASGTGKYIKGYIVGYIDGKSLTEGMKFEAGGTTNIVLAASADETDVNNCMPIQLPTETAAPGIRSNLNMTDHAENLKKEVLLYGDIETYFGTTGLKNTTYAKIGDTEYGKKPGETPDTPDTPDGSTSYDFTKSQGDWTIVNAIALPSGLSYVWAQDSKYGMKASAYVSGTRYETDSWLVSPALSLANGGTMAFSQAQRYAASGCTDLHIMVSSTYSGGDIDVSQWTEVTPSQWPDGSSWTYVDCTATLPAGTKYVAFRYTSTTSTAATWEIKTVSIQ